MHGYQDPSSAMTLGEALAELRAAEGDVTPEAGELTAALEAHDVVHIIFGLDTSEIDEVVAHAWMLLGTTLTHAELHAAARSRLHRHLSAQLGHLGRLRLMLRALPRLVRAARRARRMLKRWPWQGYRQFLDRPLTELRAEFGIVLDARQVADRLAPRGPHHRLSLAAPE